VLDRLGIVTFLSLQHGSAKSYNCEQGGLPSHRYILQLLCLDHLLQFGTSGMYGHYEAKHHDCDQLASKQSPTHEHAKSELHINLSQALRMSAYDWLGHNQ